VQYRVRCTTEALVHADDISLEKLQKILTIMRKTLLAEGYGVISVEVIQARGVEDATPKAAPVRRRR
jgi:hypothetical protein